MNSFGLHQPQKGDYYIIKFKQTELNREAFIFLWLHWHFLECGTPKTVLKYGLYHIFLFFFISMYLSVFKLLKCIIFYNFSSPFSYQSVKHRIYVNFNYYQHNMQWNYWNLFWTSVLLTTYLLRGWCQLCRSW